MLRICGLLSALAFTVASSSEIIYVGSYTNKISRYELFEDGSLTLLSKDDSGLNPTWLEFSKDKKYLYAVGETNDEGGEFSGAVSSFLIEDDYSLTLKSR
jgi:6-phosphogluconolactonase (cycloisomerase 2 family)